MKQLRMITVAQALWLICLLVGSLFAGSSGTNWIPGLPIKVNLSSIIYTIGFLSMFLVSQYLVFAGRIDEARLDFTVMAIVIYTFTTLWMAENPAAYMRWLLASVLAIAVEDWISRRFGKKSEESS